MRVLRLTIEGFGPFRNKQVVDFSALTLDGVFLIAGKTGAGKSSILDAIVYALYDYIPRFDKKSDEVRSRFCEPTDPTEVTIEFIHRGEEYRITRSPSYERPSQRGSGTVTVAPKQTFAKREDGEWQVLATKVREVEQLRASLFPLSAPQFLQVIMLAQGKFQEFLHATSTDRKSLLRTLFASERFDAITDIAKVRADERTAALAGHRHTLAEIMTTLIGDDETETTTLSVSDLNARQAANEHEHERAKAASDAAAEQYRAARELELERTQIHRDQLARNARRQELKALEARDATIEAEVGVPLRRHEAASVLAPLVHEAARRNEALNSELTTLHAAKQRLDDAIGQLTAAQCTELVTDEVIEAREHDRLADLTADNLTNLLDRCTSVLHELSDAQTVTSDHARVSAEITQLTETRTSLLERVGELNHELEELPARISADRDELTTIAERLAVQEHTQTELERSRSRRTAATEALAMESTLDTLRAGLTQALAEYEAAIATERELLHRQLRGSASRLARELQPGEPCAVCGSRSHPSPAPDDASPVAADQLTEAEAITKQRGDTVEAARAKLGDARARHEGFIVAAESRDVEHWDARVRELTEQLTELKQLAHRRDLLTTRIDETTARHQACTSNLELERARLDETNHALVTNRTTEQALSDRLSRLAGEFSSASQRRNATELLRDAGLAFRDALAAVDVARAESARAATLAAERIEASSFDSAAAVKEATLTDSAANELRSRLEAHTAARTAARAYLDRDEVNALPETLVDLESAIAAAAHALEERDREQQVLTTAANRLEREQQLINRAIAVHRAIEHTSDDAERWQRLALDLRGQNEHRQSLEAFVLAAYLEDIVAATNARLGQTTQGRYELVLDDRVGSHRAQSGLGLSVIDLYNGAMRPTTSLSGGETFLVSLSLALGLADVVADSAGGVELETLFIDEGFGALDPDTLELALQTLDQLRSAGRVIGVISHVPAMHDRIPTKIEVEVMPDRSSRITTATAIAD